MWSKCYRTYLKNTSILPAALFKATKSRSMWYYYNNSQKYCKQEHANNVQMHNMAYRRQHFTTTQQYPSRQSSLFFPKFPNKIYFLLFH